ncbi:Beta-ketoacyl synthase [Herpetosiphon aurantiacus DSM 785]|uniref:Phenolphthiocerol/phthiocerol polyketide synthase subunit E n=1 Tax=Herpetosiphon aurantiacus (strain ATCC 23779 / DSM 785 / 114-95) TaxID=316274 RepID=A9AV09_HERA2|nr:Beta-ketoacyl synthase [Herpetosiphon aurantiacus DSM 785]
MTDRAAYDAAYDTAVAIVGMSGRFPGASTVDAFWQNLTAGERSIRTLGDAELLAAGVDPELLRDPQYVKAGAFVDDIELFDAAFFGYTPREAEVMDPQHRLFLECAWQALEQAGYDPDGFRGSIGVFAGSATSSYRVHNIHTNPEIAESVGGLQLAVGNDSDSLASTVSYKLNLRGPSVAVQTFCSTSLVAVHMACQSLLTYECNIALAGGAAITVPQGVGYLYQEGGILSPDGHCRTFDAKAQGSVMGSGVGVVTLKRFEDALNDGDTIYAVIRGSTVNNDGIRKVGYTAPGLNGQSAVITIAQNRAEVDPDTVSYIEAHGTATPLGDSIELAALIKAFERGTERKQFCALGSVKPNIGHLDRASGVTGLIKTTMALHHRQLPPNLDFETPSPDIDLANSPFYVNTQLRDWPADGAAPRRAGVNSFGLGGTNVHVVLEEAPAPAPVAPARPAQLLVLSAKTATALEAMTDNLAAYLAGAPADLADVAFTLQAGRTRFNHRRAFVCESAADAAQVLQTRDLRRITTVEQSGRNRPVAFVFPGVGDHYAGMAKTLYATEAVFREAVDQCAELLAPRLGQDLRAALYPADQPAAAAAHTLFAATAASSRVAGALHQTALAQPAVFVVEYALVQLLASWGIRPQALLGYSLGEYVAATVAGVLSLEDALTLVAKRAQWIQAQPHGAMLAVSLGVEAIQPYLNTEVALAVVNSPMTCVLAGPHAALELVKIHLEEDEVASRWLETSHAFHSPMLAPVAAELTALVRTLRLQTPKIPYISNVTGTWITDAEATDPGYWARHMVETVQFADGVGTLLADAQLTLLEVGPGQALGSFIRQHPACGRDRFGQIVATLPGAAEATNDLVALLNGLGRLWLAGVPIDWAGLHGKRPRRRVPLPTYPFERKRFWIDAAIMPAALAAGERLRGRHADVTDWFYRPDWAPAALGVPAAPGHWLILPDAHGLGKAVASSLRAAGHTVTLATAGPADTTLMVPQIPIDPTDAAAYELLLDTLRADGGLPSHILWLGGLTPLDSALTGPARFQAAQATGYYDLLQLAQALVTRVIDEAVQLLVVTAGMQAVGANAIPVAEHATLLGLATVIGQENVTIRVRSVDLAMADDAAAELLAAECLASGDALRVAYRDGQRLEERYQPIRLETPGSSVLQSGGVYVITGGLGGVGLVLAEHLARTAQAKLVLVGRQGLPERAAWDAWLREHGADDATSQRIQRVRMIEAAGGTVEVMAADVADPEQLRGVFAETEARFGTLYGVLHAAGISDSQAYLPLETIGPKECEWHFQPKAYGLYALEAALDDRSLDFCVVFSSVSSVLGGLGFAGYAAANSFMNAFTQRHNRTHAVPWVSVNWDTWHLRAGQHDVIGATVAQYEMSPAEGADAFERAAATRNEPVIINSTGDLDARIRQWVRLESVREQPEREREAAGSTQQAVSVSVPLRSTSEYEQRITAVWQHVLGIETIGIHDNFFDLGGNSLIALQLIARLKKEFKTQVPAVAIFEAPTISALVQYMLPDAPVVAPADALLVERRQRVRQTAEQDGIAIIGMVGRFPGASTVDALWQNVADGVEAFTRFTDEELRAAGVPADLINDTNYVKVRPVLHNDISLFDAAFFGYTPREAEFLDPQQRLFQECAWEALEQAGYDTQRYPGLVGVFGGTNVNAYLYRLVEDPELRDLMSESITLQNDKDALATYVSYKLNLRGPSFSIQTYCSTSLVATHLACRSLRAGDCDIALAGGVSIRVPVNTGYLFQEGDQGAPDGRCRTFDALAEGTNFGDGVAIVVLKRLADALADGDTIHAVIRGSAINNDGGLKVGYTAPSVVGQAAVVQAALADANLAADAISYVEAHGTATKLGDPIEVAALTKAYRTMTDKVGFCAISSVKPNIGHLDRASGATGLIKTVMALKHNVIPPTLHFQAPNPEIDFASSPFFVPTALTPWTRNGTPRRAGVNSLGVGGTNAHVIVEEAPQVGPSGPGRAAELLVLSAKTATALEAATTNLAAHLEEQPMVNLADVAHTLQVGRRVFEHRRVVVARNVADAVGLLRSGDARRVLTLAQKPTSRGVAFVFPGVGDHYVGMAEGLYATEGVFRATVDRCCALLTPLLGSPIRKEIYPDGGAPVSAGIDLRAMLRENATPRSAGRLHQTAWAQPAVFVVEYALVQLLASWGIRPQALLGYSVGEYVAAAVAGVLSLEDALTVVAKRAQWIQAQPAGSMLAVSLGADAIGAYVGGAVALAVVNSPMTCVLAGPQAALEAVKTRLDGDEVASRWLETSHAFHSPMLAPVQAELTALAGTLRLQAPRIPYISNVTGTWITDAEATDPGYWARHMVETVQFADGVGTLLADAQLVVLEVGPGQALGSFIRQHPACGRDRFGQIVATVRGMTDTSDDLEVLLSALGRLWLHDVVVDWASFRGSEVRQRIPLPTYPFERQRFWVEPRSYVRTPVQEAAVIGRKPNIADWFYTPVWEAQPLPAKGSAQPAGPYLVFVDEQGFGAQVVGRLESNGVTVIKVRQGGAFAQLDATSFAVRPDIRDDYAVLFSALQTNRLLPQAIVHLWNVASNARVSADEAGFGACQVYGFYSLLHLAQAVGGIDLESTLPITVFSNSTQPVTGNERLYAEQSPSAVTCRVIGQENPAVFCRNVDICVPEQAGAEADQLAMLLEQELLVPSQDIAVAYREGRRFVQHYRADRLEPISRAVPAPLRMGGVYLITGGLGGIGTAIAGYLAEKAQAKLVLLGRTPLPPREEWDGLAVARGPEDGLVQKIAKIRAMEAHGAEVLTLSADVGDPAQLSAALAEIRRRFGALHGVVHGAGHLDQSGFQLIQDVGHEPCEAHFKPKVYALYHLEAMLRDQELDFCLLLSSVSSVLGGLGYVGYTAANYFMDIFTHRLRQSPSNRWISVNWDTWHLKAGQHDGATVAQYELFPFEGVDAFGRILERAPVQIINSTGDLDTRIKQWVLLESIRSNAASSSPAASHERPAIDTQYVPVNSEYERRIAAVWQQVLGIGQIGIDDNFFDLGGNSLTALQLISRLKKEFKTQISAVAIFEAPTIRAMAQYLMPDAPPAVDLAETLLVQRRQRVRQTAEQDGIAIIGMAGRFPGASNVDEFWDNLANGVEAFTAFTDAELLAAGVLYEQVHDLNYVKRRPILKEDVTLFDAAFFGYTPREAEFLDPQQRLFHECAWEALEQAGYDTQRYPGLVGIYGGANLNTYLMQLAFDPDVARNFTDSVFLENDKDALTTNVSYKLNLRGPSFAVQTYCSTSLVATHLACRSLRAGDCDIALAGGVSIRVPVNTGHLFQEGDQVSPDGSCRTFDAQAAGTTWADGVAVLVLKRLADALADGDTIHAVIRGSAINNDGGLKVGYTAPSVVGQAAVVQAALADANLAADAISYVEAHGTATKLGDPIEVASLTKAYRTMTDKVGFCAISSVKPNVGHLDRAAGATGLIKTVMALKHNVIPPTLHFQTPNPEIDFASSPFFVPTALTPWTRNGTPRRAGVNSLGVGGTNAHVIVEEAPQVGPSGPGRAVELLVLSARTPSALETMTVNLTAYLEGQPTVNLADVAHTLQVGRRVFEHRRVVVARDATSAAALLRSGDARRVLTLAQKPTSRGVAFVFPGVGDHYVGMAEGLYATEGVFRATVDRCCALLTPLLGSPIRKEIYPDGGAPVSAGIDLRAMLREDATPRSAGRLHQTAWAQPAVFVVEYALVQLLASWGIRPQALLGYSVGEYVAATVAGVLSLEDALTLVAKRAQWIQAQPAGSMLAVSLSAEAIGAYVGGAVALAVVNSPMTCVLAGPQAALEAVKTRLDGDEVASRWLETSHAFHSPMLAPVQAELTALAGTLRLQAPRIPYISNVTGTWITDAEATDPGYWARHMVETVQFADGVGTLLADAQLVVLEVGPGQALGSFIRQHPACGRDRFGQIVATVRGMTDTSDDLEVLLSALGRLWLHDVVVDWAGFRGSEVRQRIPLPTYPFERQRFWIEPNLNSRLAAAHRPIRRPDIGDWLAAPSWKRSIQAGSAGVAARLAEPHCWLMLADGEGLAAELTAWLEQRGQTVITVMPGASFAALGQARYMLRPTSREDFTALLQTLERQGHAPSRVVHCWLFGAQEDADSLSDATLTATLDVGFYSLLALAQALGDQGVEWCEINAVTAAMQEVTGQENLQVAASTVIGPCKIIPQEYPNLTARSIDILLPAGAAERTALVAQLGTELATPPTGDQVAFRGAHRWVQVFEPITVPAAPASHPRLRTGGVYLLTGGLGGIALGLARDLAATLQAKLVLVNRSGLPDRATWPALLERDGAEQGVGRRIQQVLDLEVLGAEVLVIQADVTDTVAMARAVAEAQARFGTIHGVLHTAGVPGVGLMQLKDAATAAAELAPKVQGTLALTSALAGIPLDFLVLFSSVTSATGGGPGQVAYCAANAFLDAYARKHATDHGQTVAVSWGEWLWDAWSEGLQGFAPEVQARFRAYRTTFGITFDEGADILRRILAEPLAHVFVTSEDLLPMAERSRRESAARGLEELQRQQEARPTYPRPEVGTSFVEPQSVIEQQIAGIWSTVLGIAPIGLHDNFFDLGGNSLLGLDLFSRIRKALKVDKLPAYVLYEAPTVATQAAYLTPAPEAALVTEAVPDLDVKIRQKVNRFKQQSSLEDA